MKNYNNSGLTATGYSVNNNRDGIKGKEKRNHGENPPQSNLV
jgi:hypothetical protein